MTAIEIADPRYPASLRNIADPPAVLYMDGTLEPIDTQAIAVVGSRRATPYGLRVASVLTEQLARLGFTIVSGLALGIDAAAHAAALRAGGRTIAVLGCGLDVLYPREHGGLRAAILEAGALLTELPLGALPRAQHFPRRNRILSGLSLGVLVVEATDDSGSLITARCALDQGREVFAVPGPVDAVTSRGTHALLKQGAKLTETVDDMIEELLPQLERPLTVSRSTKGESCFAPGASTQETASFSNEERKVYAVIGGEPLSIDELTERASLNAAVVASALLGLELKSAVRQLPGQRYQLA